VREENRMEVGRKSTDNESTRPHHEVEQWSLECVMHFPFQTMIHYSYIRKRAHQWYPIQESTVLSNFFAIAIICYIVVP
jgi:hypothetical protein